MLRSMYTGMDFFVPNGLVPPTRKPVWRLAVSGLHGSTVRISRVVYSLIDKSSIEVSHKELSYSTTYGV